MAVEKRKLSLTVNGEPYELWINPKTTLLELLNRHLFLTGAKMACISNSCGACTVILDGKSVKSCNTLAMQADNKDVLTIEGLAQNGQLHPIQESWMEYAAFQCGFCTPGVIMSTKALLDENPQPTREEIMRGIEGNICRCTGYIKILDAIEDAAKKLQEVKK